MKKIKVVIVLLIVVFGALSFIQKTKNYATTPIQFIVPNGWPQPIYNFDENPLTEEGFELGKKLFYDGILSADSNFSCASCHQQFGAFNNYDHTLSHGINNQLTLRNAPALQNLAWQKKFMWDGSITHLHLQPKFPITASNEMGANLDTVLHKLNTDSLYSQLFLKAFGTKNITYNLLAKALSQFLVMLVSSNSKYDKVMAGEAAFSNSEKLGYELFKQKCIGCHAEPFFTDNSFRNIGLMPDYSIKDFGRMMVTKDSNDFMKFRVPSLRNVQVTFPYGHDGRFFRLFDVFNHYKEGIIAIPNTDGLVKNYISISNFEAGRITAFLNTLTDSSFLQNKKFVPSGTEISPTLRHLH